LTKEGAKMKDKKEKIRFTTRLNEDLAKQLHYLSFEKRLPKNTIVNQALEEYLKGVRNV
jgi:predicted DNA-binding protein